jgi:hypothetical protein
MVSIFPAQSGLAVSSQVRNLPDNSTAESSEIEKKKSDLLDFYVAVSDEPCFA